MQQDLVLTPPSMGFKYVNIKAQLCPKLQAVGKVLLSLSRCGIPTRLAALSRTNKSLFWTV